MLPCFENLLPYFENFVSMFQTFVTMFRKFRNAFQNFKATFSNFEIFRSLGVEEISTTTLLLVDCFRDIDPHYEYQKRTQCLLRGRRRGR